MMDSVMDHAIDMCKYALPLTHELYQPYLFKIESNIILKVWRNIPSLATYLSVLRGAIHPIFIRK